MTSASSSIIILLIVLLYLFICCVLVYIFFKNKLLWHSIYTYLHNNIFNVICIINPHYIKQLFYEYFICQKHAILNLTFSDDINNNKLISNPNDDINTCLCLLCFTELEDTQTQTQTHNTNNIYIQEITQLYNIYNLYKQIDKLNLYSLDNNSYKEESLLISQYKMYLWLLENSIKDYEYIKNATTDIYYKLKDTFTHINTNEEKPPSNPINPINPINLENLVYIENNLQIYKHIININSNLYGNLYGNSNGNNNEHLPEQKNKKKQIEKLKEINSFYLVALFNDIYAFIKQINILALQSII